MKIAQLLSGIDIILTNQEKQFVENHRSHVSIDNMSDHDQWLAQNLVRKGIYSISNNNQTLIKNIDEKNSR
jgi:hypothetical protein